MSQLRQEDSATIVSMLHRHSRDNRSMSTMSSAEDDQGSSLNNTTASIDISGQLPHVMTEFTKDGECSSEVVVPQCPVCGRSLPWVGGDVMLLNKHVDECLNEVAVSDLLASEKQTSPVNR